METQQAVNGGRAEGRTLLKLMELIKRHFIFNVTSEYIFRSVAKTITFTFFIKYTKKKHYTQYTDFYQNHASSSVRPYSHKVGLSAKY